MTATSSYKTYLYHSADGTTYTKLVDIVSSPAMGGDPELLDTTTLSDPAYTNILGLQSSDLKTFTANYDKTDFTTIKALEGTVHYWAVYFGDNGALGKFTWQGYVTVYPTELGVNEVRRMNIVISTSTAVEFE